jgi:hypothetical protein
MRHHRFYGGRIRHTPWWLRMIGRPPYRMWFVPGPLPIGAHPDWVWRGGYWRYFEDDDKPKRFSSPAR